jgi:hypothetical protein
MTPKGRAHGRQRAARILIYGESTNDTAALRELVAALRPELAGRLKPLRQPLVLIKNANANEIPARARKIAASVKAEMTLGPVCGVIAHEDCDDVEPADADVATKIESALTAQLPVAVHAVVPAWELEAWWFLWPDAVVAFQPSWRRPDDYVGKRVGLVKNAKEELGRKIKPRGKGARRVRPYAEKDSVSIAAKVREMDLANSPQATSHSYERFRARLDECTA